LFYLIIFFIYLQNSLILVKYLTNMDEGGRGPSPGAPPRTSKDVSIFFCSQLNVKMFYNGSIK